MTSKRKITNVAYVLGTGALVTLGAIAGAGFSAGTMRDGVEYGDEVRMGDGTARTYIELRDGVPVELGIALSEAAMEGLPGHHTPGGIELEPGHTMFFETPALPASNPTPYEHVLLGWNPGGHEPPGVYDVPHFDFHFYTTSNDARLAMTHDDPAFDAKVSNHPAGAYAPQGYVAIPGGVPLMGAHWVDPTTPELNGQPFTTTFLFGSWDGDLVFTEPMITRAYLETKPDFRASIPIPADDEAGYRPSAYRVYFDETTREYRVALTDFVWRDAATN